VANVDAYDAIVIGTGGVGSAALFHLADRGGKVLGLDQYPPAHQHGSSHGQSRIIRQAYFEHSDYVPLLLRSYELWRDVESRAQRKLFHQVGLLEVGPADGVVIPGVLRAAAEHQLEVEELTPKAAQDRFPEFNISAEHVAVFEPTAGYLLVEECVSAHLQLANSAGADWRQEAVVRWELAGQGVRIQTEAAEYVARHVVVASGAWTKLVLPTWGIPLRVLAKQQYWFEPRHDIASADGPAFFFETAEGYFYGFPPIGGRGIKVARHSGGMPWAAPQSLCEVVDAADLAQVRNFANQQLRHTGNLVDQQACMYTMSPDEHFIVDWHHDSDAVLLVAGLSGHGFKFTPVLGEIMADLVLAGETSLPVEFLLGRRFR
jgi:monomeric sarcosine oxidase